MNRLLLAVLFLTALAAGQTDALVELSHDDGVAARLAEWPVGLFGWGTRFTPSSYPVFIESLKVYLEFPTEADHCRYQLAIVWEDSVGLPGETYFLSSVLAGTAGTSGWQSMFIGARYDELVVADGGFFVFYRQVGERSECPQVGVDAETAPGAEKWQYREGAYVPDTSAGDLMVRAVVNLDTVPARSFDVRVLAFEQPGYDFVRRPFDAALVPTLVVGNFGYGSASAIPFYLVIDSAGTEVYTEMETVSMLRPGEVTRLRFAAWEPGGDGHRYEVTAYGSGRQEPRTTTVDVFAGAYTGRCSTGYEWIDSDTAGGPEFAWVDTFGAGIVPSGDEMRIFVPIGFNFPYFDTSYNNCYVCSNGWLALGWDPGTTDSLPKRLPDARQPNACLYPWWDNLALGPGHGGGRVYYKVDRTYPNRRFTVTWLNANRVGTDTTDLLCFQAVLHETGDIIYQYRDVTAGDPFADRARFAGIGLESPDGRDGLCYLYDRPPLATTVNGLVNRVDSDRAILFRRWTSSVAARRVETLRPPGPTILHAPDLARFGGRIMDVQGRDVTGRKGALRPGVYFLREASGVGRPASTKVIVTR